MQQGWAVFGSLRHMGGAVGSWSLSLLQHLWAEADDMGFWARAGVEEPVGKQGQPGLWVPLGLG